MFVQTPNVNAPMDNQVACQAVRGSYIFACKAAVTVLGFAFLAASLKAGWSVDAERRQGDQGGGFGQFDR